MLAKKLFIHFKSIAYIKNNLDFFTFFLNFIFDKDYLKISKIDKRFFLFKFENWYKRLLGQRLLDNCSVKLAAYLHHVSSLILPTASTTTTNRSVALAQDSNKSVRMSAPE